MTLSDLLEAVDLVLLGGDTDDALELLAEAIETAPENPLPYDIRADLLIRMGGRTHLRRACKDLVKAVERGMATPAVYFKLVRALSELGDVDRARAAYGEALALAPDDSRLREWGIRLALQAGEPAAALQLAQDENAREPGNFHWMRWEAELLLQTGSYPAARQAFTALVDAHMPASPDPWAAPQWCDVLLKRAEACWQTGAFAAARADLDRAEALMPDDPGVPFARGLLAWAEGEPDRALDPLRAGLQQAAPEVRAAFLAVLADYPNLNDL